MLNSLLVFLTLLSLSFQQICIENVATNETYPYTGIFDPSDSANYCADLITYPVSETTAITAASRHSQSRSTYKTISSKWYLRENKNDDPTNDCLGIARMVICAKYFPRCSEELGDNFPVCDYLCELFSNRCPSEDSLYGILCEENRKENCSFSNRITLNMALALLSFFVYYFAF